MEAERRIQRIHTEIEQELMYQRVQRQRQQYLALERQAAEFNSEEKPDDSQSVPLKRVRFTDEEGLHLEEFQGARLSDYETSEEEWEDTREDIS